MTSLTVQLTIQTTDNYTYAQAYRISTHRIWLGWPSTRLSRLSDLGSVCSLFVTKVCVTDQTLCSYPFLMPQVQLFDAMHRGKGIFLQRKRVVFFWGTLIAIFVWEWFPEYIAP